MFGFGGFKDLAGKTPPLVANPPHCRTCSQPVYDVPKAMEQDYRVYCSERCLPTPKRIETR